MARKFGRVNFLTNLMSVQDTVQNVQTTFWGFSISRFAPSAVSSRFFDLLNSMISDLIIVTSLVVKDFTDAGATLISFIHGLCFFDIEMFSMSDEEL